MPPKLTLVIPCYNEEDVLPIMSGTFLDKIISLADNGKIDSKSNILFVNDGSSDGTWDIISNLAMENAHFTGISLSRNRGHQNALLAGLMEAKEQCDITISVDCDGQDDINAVDEMIQSYLDGHEIVYGVRSKREADQFFKRFTAEGFYRFMLWMGVDCIYNHADYRLISSRALSELANFKEVNLFLRGMIPLLGFKSACVPYERKERIAGKSHYPLKKMLALAFDGITSLSMKPMQLIIGLGIFLTSLGVIDAVALMIKYMIDGALTESAFVICLMCFLGGIQLLSLGIIGEYIGKIYLETKHRPRYIISERTTHLNQTESFRQR